MKVRPLSHTKHKKINSKWIVDLNVRSKTVRIIEDNRAENFWDFGLGKYLFYMTLKAWSIWHKIDKLDLTKYKNFCLSKVPLRKWKDK